MPLKTIRSKADLAINGAPPAIEEPLQVGYPNINYCEAFLTRNNLAHDNQWLTKNRLEVPRLEYRGANKAFLLRPPVS
jgi:hypothetical protein